VFTEKWLSWSSFHAQNSGLVDITTTTCMAMLSLVKDSANSIAMIRHSMDIIKKAVSHLNPHQTPVLTGDLPLYAIAKQIQWNMPEKYGEDCFVVLLGGLHVEISALRALGHLLMGSGWVEALTEAGITTPGTAESFLAVSHVRRCRHVHEVTVAVLHCLQNRAYSSYQAHCGEGGEVLSFDQWCAQQSLQQPLFAYWQTVKNFELHILLFVYSLRTSDFLLYIDSLTQLLPWFFVFDRTHYTRWLSVHVRDMARLCEHNKDVHDQFVRGNFTAKKIQVSIRIHCL